MNGATPKTDEERNAREDAVALERAFEIKADAPRYKKAMEWLRKLLEEKQKELEGFEAALGEGEK